MARLVLAASRAYLRAVQLSVELRRGGPREEVDAFLSAAHEVITLEHATDEAQRAVHQAMVADATESGAAQFVVIELTQAFEEAADALMHAAHLVREHTLARLVGSEAVARRTSDAPPARNAALSLPVQADHVYVLGDPHLPVPDASVIGGKAYGLARLVRAGLRVPEATVLTTGLWRSRPDPVADETSLRRTVKAAVEGLERQTGLQLAGPTRPLLLSVRSGAPVSMPGMLETVLNVGMCETAARGLIALTGNPRLAWDSYRRLIESFAAVVHGCPREPFEHAVHEELAAARVTRPRDLGAGVLEQLVRAHLDRYARLTDEPFPQDPLDQLVAAVNAVLDSWTTPKAREYRRLHGISGDMGTAVILQRMVFGNAGGVSGAGVGFTRDPALGERRLYIDFLLDAQGEDIVGGRQTAEGLGELAVVAPDIVAEIERVSGVLEAEFADAQEFELTVQEGELFLLQTRTAKRTPWAALRIATDQVREGLISRERPSSGSRRSISTRSGACTSRHRTARRSWPGAPPRASGSGPGRSRLTVEPPSASPGPVRHRCWPGRTHRQRTSRPSPWPRACSRRPAVAPRTQPSSPGSLASLASSAALSSRSTSRHAPHASATECSPRVRWCASTPRPAACSWAPPSWSRNGRSRSSKTSRLGSPGLVNRNGPQPSPCPSDRKLQHGRNLSRDGASTGTSSTFASRTGRRLFRVSWTTALSRLREPATCVTGRRPAARR